MQNTTRNYATAPDASVTVNFKTFSTEVDVFVCETMGEEIYLKFIHHDTGARLGEIDTYRPAYLVTEEYIFDLIDYHLQGVFPNYEEMHIYLYNTKFKKV